MQDKVEGDTRQFIVRLMIAACSLIYNNINKYSYNNNNNNNNNVLEDSSL